MDSLESLVNSINISKVKKSEEKDSYKAKKAQKSSILKEKFADYSPPSPVFKPQESPKDLPPAFSLPVSDLSTDDNDDTNMPQDFKKSMSCPSNTQLNIWMNNEFDNEIEEFQLVDENNSCAFLIEEEASKINGLKENKEQPIKQVESANKQSDSPQSKRQLNQPKDKRFRSQSETITAFTIFHFLDQKNQTKKLFS